LPGIVKTGPMQAIGAKRNCHKRKVKIRSESEFLARCKDG